MDVDTSLLKSSSLILLDFPTKREAEDKCGPANALSPSEIKNILELAHITKRDVFYDLGSGYGRIVRIVVRKTKAKYVYGIEKRC
jgi:16S rRNA A1518/A1519 N6-dimethyltransferase RsmA/KsgA/DIM1 with predicted DNA glycosylase/AP lyase activity